MILTKQKVFFFLGDVLSEKSVFTSVFGEYFKVQAFSSLFIYAQAHTYTHDQLIFFCMCEFCMGPTWDPSNLLHLPTFVN